MFLTLLLASIVWLVIFIASAAFDVWFELVQPRFLKNNIFGRAVAVVGIAPFIITIGITAIIAFPIAAVMEGFFGDPWGEDTAWNEALDALRAVYDWFTNWAPAFIKTGQE